MRKYPKTNSSILLRYPIYAVMGTVVKKLFKKIPLSLMATSLGLLVSACIPFAQQKKTDCTASQTYSATLRRCLSNDEIAGITGSNHLPQVAGDQTIAAFTEGTSTTFNVEAGSDVDNDTLTYIITAEPSHGTITNCMDGSGSGGGTDLSCTYTPDLEYSGTDSFTYKVHDGHASSVASGTISFTVTDVDDAPTISDPANATVDEDTVVNLYYTVDEGGSGSIEDAQGITFTLTSNNTIENFIDRDGSLKIYWGSTLLKSCTAAEVLSVISGSNCSISLGDSITSADAQYVRVQITMDSHENGTWTVNGDVSDGVNLTAVAPSSVTYTVTAINDAPTLAAISNQSFTENDAAPAATITLTLDEGGNSAPFVAPETVLQGSEDSDDVSVTVESSNTDLIDPTSANVSLECDGKSLAGNLTDTHGTWVIGTEIGVDLGGNCLAANDIGDVALVKKLYLNAEPGASGTAVITVTVTDVGPATPLSVSKSFTVTVADYNDAPEFNLHGSSGVGNDFLTNDVTGHINCHGTTSDCDMFENETIHLDFQVDEDSINTDVLNVYEDDQTLNVLVTSSSDKTACPYSGISVYYAGTYLAHPNADDLTEISLNDGSSNASASLPESGTHKGLDIAVSPASFSSGSCEITIKLTDYDASGLVAGKSTTKKITLHLTDVDNPPTIGTITAQTANEGLPINDIALTGLSEGSGDAAESIIMTATVAAGASCSLSASELLLYNAALVPAGNVHLYNTTYPTTDLLLAATNQYPLGANVAGEMTNGGFLLNTLDYWLSLDPVNGETGVTCMGITLTDAGASATTVYFKVTINPVSVTFNSWEQIMAVGDKVDHTARTLDDGYIYFEWAPFTMSGSTISGYNVYCSEDSALYTFDFTKPLNSTTIPNSIYEFDSRTTAMDTTHPCLNTGTAGEFQRNKAFYFTVVALDAAGVLTGADDSAATIRVIMPPNNMSLVHRYMANKEMCDLMEQTPDLSLGNACLYSGPGYVGISGTNYYDFYNTGTSKNYDLLVDTYEAGCPYSPASSGECPETGNGCIGKLDPNTRYTATGANKIYYNRGNGLCYASTGAGTVWSSVAVLDGAGTGAVSSLVSADYRSAKLPPLTQLTQTQAYNYCNDAAIDDVPIKTDSAGTTLLLDPRLPDRKEFIAMSAWSPNLTDTEIDSIESGGSLDVNNYCNGQTNNGLTYTSASVPTSSFWDTLPATSGWGEELVVTGSDATADCVSRYGIQDLVGNVAEYTVERIECTTGTGTCVYKIGVDGAWGAMIDLANDDSDGLSTDTIKYYFGPALAVDFGYGPYGTTNITSWDWDDETYSANYMFIPYGLPSRLSATYLTSAIGPANNGITGSQLHGDRIYIQANTLAAENGANDFGAFTNGGSYKSGSDNAGRWTLEVLPEEFGADMLLTTTGAATSVPNVGFRCLLRVPY